MRGALGTSLALHAGALAFAVVSIHNPEPLEARVQSVSIEVVPIEEFAAVMKGAEEAPLVDPPAVEPVETEPEIADAVNVGETETDVDVPDAPVTARVPVAATPVPTAPEPDPAPTFEPIDIASVPAPAERPAAPTIERAATVEPDVPAIAEPVETPEPEPVEVAAAEPEPATVEPDPVDAIVEQAIEAARQAVEQPTEPAEPEPPQFADLPTSGPKALFRPARPTTPRAPTADEPTPPRRTAATERGEPNVTDRIADLLNRETASGGGARRPTETASVGGNQNAGVKLTRSEIDGLRSHIQSCWTNPLTSFEPSPVVKVLMKLNPDGTVNGRPTILSSPGGRIAQAIEGAGTRALRRCGPYTMLPADKHGGANGWNEVVVNFSLDSGVAVGG